MYIIYRSSVYCVVNIIVLHTEKTSFVILFFDIFFEVIWKQTNDISEICLCKNKTSLWYAIINKIKSAQKLIFNKKNLLDKLRV